MRMAGEETQPTRFAFVEFSDVGAVAQALTYNGVMFFNRPLKIHHSNNAIVKPQSKSSEAAQREIEEAMKKVNRSCTMVENSQEYRLKYWATRSSVRLFARTAHSFARSLTSLTPSLVGQ